MTMQSDNVSLSAWLDSKTVMTMSTGFDPKGTSTVQRTQKDSSSLTLTCPLACAEYNKYMGGVDRGDQLRGYYHIRMKSRKFYKYIANFLFDVSVTNAFILYVSTHHGTKMTNKTFREMLADELVGDYCSRKRAGRGNNIIRPLQIQHFPTKVPSGNNERKRGRCSLCREKRRRRDTPWFCEQCGVWLCHPGTRHEDCFYVWHSRLE